MREPASGGICTESRSNEVGKKNQRPDRCRRITRGYHLARIRYFNTDVPFLSTGTRNCAAHAAVFVNLYVDDSISQSPPMGSLTSTVIGVSLWLRSVISNSISHTRSPMRL